MVLSQSELRLDPVWYRILGSRCCAAMAGDVNRAARWRTWKFTTNSFAAIPAKIRSRTSSRSAHNATLEYIEGCKL